MGLSEETGFNHSEGEVKEEVEQWVMFFYKGGDKKVCQAEKTELYRTTFTSDIVFKSKGPKTVSELGRMPCKAWQKDIADWRRMKGHGDNPLCLVSYTGLSVLTFKKGETKGPCLEGQKRDVTYVLHVSEFKKKKMKLVQIL